MVTGFTSGIAIIILSTQINDYFGLGIKLPPDFVGKIENLVGHFAPNWPTVALSITCGMIIWFWPRNWGRRVPDSIAVIVILTRIGMSLVKPPAGTRTI